MPSKYLSPGESPPIHHKSFSTIKKLTNKDSSAQLSTDRINKKDLTFDRMIEKSLSFFKR
jgi:hypothetical protein